MKKMKQTKGFTLIELLAVIVILAIIALIAVPVIMNIIDKANKAAFKDTAYVIISAGELYFSERQLDINGMQEDKIFDLSETTELELKGEIPSGNVMVTASGKISLAVENGRYCIIKGYKDTDITLVEDYETCELPETPIINPNKNISSTDECIKYSDVCANGTEVSVAVNESETYNFYVIDDTGTELTLIMDRNLGDNVAWISSGDYKQANTDNTSCDYTACNDEGPLTAVAALKTRTSGWINIPEREYLYKDNDNTYTSFTETMRARMLTYAESRKKGCQIQGELTCPNYLYINLYNTGDNGTHGYWLADDNALQSSWVVYLKGHIAGFNMVDNVYIGIRPVITISK